MNPPNLKKQHAVHDPMYRNCASLARDYTCTKYELPVEMDAVCDSWESIFLKESRQVTNP